MAKLVTKEPHDRNCVLRVLVSFVKNLCNNPSSCVSSFTTHPNDIARCRFVYPYSTNDKHLSFRPFHGEAEISTLGPYKKVAIIEDSSPVFPSDEELTAKIKSHVETCINSVPSCDRSVSIGKLFMGKMYFHVHDRMQDYNNLILHNGKTLKGLYRLRIPHIRFYEYIGLVRNLYRPTSTNDFVEFFQKRGAEFISKETLPETIELKHRQLSNRVDVSGIRLYIHNSVFVDPETLKFDFWSVQKLYPMSLNLLSNMSDFNDVFLRMSTRRYATLNDIVPDGQKPNVLTEPGLGGWLKKTDTSYMGSSKNWRIKALFHTFKTEVIHMCFNNVNFAVKVKSTRVYSFDEETFEFIHNVTIDDFAYLEFHLTQDKRCLIDTIAHFSALLLGFSKKFSGLQVCPVHQYMYESGRRRLSYADARAILRLCFERGSLSDVLGLEMNASRTLCHEKAIEMMQIIENCRNSDWFGRTRMNSEELTDKLRHIAAGEGIHI